MASFTVEEFVGNGVLREILPKLVEDGWDDVPTLKLMNLEDMHAINMTTRQKDALEIRSYLHDRSLMQYGDTLEASGKSLPELLNCSASVLSSQFGMKRGHIARFTDRTTACGISTQPPYRRRSLSSTSTNWNGSELRYTASQKIQTSSLLSRRTNSIASEKSIAELRIKEGHSFKGIVASAVAEPRPDDPVKPPHMTQDVVPYSTIENITVQKLVPEYKIGMEPLVKLKPMTMKSSDLWHERPVVLLCLRRPGCIMCRAQAHQFYSRKPVFDAMGVQLIAVLHQQIESEVKDFWPRYWGGAVILDSNMGFFKALGGGKVIRHNFVTGFLLNPQAIANYWRAKATGLDSNVNGDGNVNGGLFVVASGKSGVAYQFVERNFGDWAPIAEVIEICSRLQLNLEGAKELAYKVIFSPDIDIDTMKGNVFSGWAICD
ncbi:uncharacterized protein LOC116251539 isoform X1 [Nymphaea colorata]|nr:uncharacterized protein LOC116251539 isoform X1 [Nymphaea colorata]